MKCAGIQKLHNAGFITGGQRQKIVEHFSLKKDGRKYRLKSHSPNPNGKLTLQAIVPASGRAKIKEVFVDGKPYAEAMRNKMQ